MGIRKRPPKSRSDRRRSRGDRVALLRFAPITEEFQSKIGTYATTFESFFALGELRRNKTFLLYMYFYITLHCSRLLSFHTTLKTPGPYHPLLSSLTRTHSPTESGHNKALDRVLERNKAAYRSARL